MKIKQHLLLILATLFWSIGATAQNESYYTKRVDFSENESLESKIHKAAREVPTKEQLDWQKLEMTAFIHFGINTFTGQEWGDGAEDPEIFNPKELDARQWVKTLKEGGMNMVIVTAKHHDGFCLWPTEATDHSVASSPWKDGEGDVVKKVKEACEEFGMEFGVYLSPWDRNAESYGDSPAYNEFFLDQLTELLTWYGDVDEVWFDGAGGEEGQVYDWQAYYDKIEELQPDAVVAIMGEDVRWVGTETGYGRETEWSVTALAPGGTEESEKINEKLGLNAMSEDLGSRDIIEKANSLFWYPAEVDVSIRPGWFYHEEEDDQVKSLAKMVDIYYNSVGLNAVLLLNVPPDKRGLIHETDSARLKELKDHIDKTFDSNLMAGASFSDELMSQTIRGNNAFGAYWKTPELPATAEARLPQSREFNVIMLQEDITKGQRVEEFHVDIRKNGNWETIASSTTIGYKKLLRVPTTATDRIRLVIDKARDNAIISNFGLFKAPDILTTPSIRRDKKGEVTIETETPNPVIRYTLDGSKPGKNSMEYTGPFMLPDGGVVKARAFINDFGKASDVVTKEFFINKSKWQVASFSDQLDGYPAANAIDGNPETMWHSPWEGDVTKHPHHLEVDLGEIIEVNGFYYTPRTGENKSGTVSRYSFYISKDRENWTKVIDHGEFGNIANNPIRQDVDFDETYKTRYFKFVSHEGAFDEAWISVGEIGVKH
ncbi:MAG: alpha-L-fucosidase [Marinilabiliaceae bacterium]